MQALVDYVNDQRIKNAIADKNPQDHQAQEDLLIANAILGRTLAWCGETTTGLRYTDTALAQVKALLRIDASNVFWQEVLGLYSQQAGELLRQLGRFDAASAADSQAVEALTALLKRNPATSDFQRDLSQAQLERARLQLARADVPAAKDSAQSALATIGKLRAKAPDDLGFLRADAQARLLLGQIAARRNDKAAARSAWIGARDLVTPALHKGGDPNLLATYVEAVLRLDQPDAAKPVIARLDALGYRTPDFVALLAENHIAYPPNPAFQERVGAIMRGDAASAAQPRSSPSGTAGKKP